MRFNPSEMLIIIGLSTTLVAILAFVLAYYLYYKNKLTLIAGINKENLSRVSKPKELGRKAGIGLFIIGLLTLLLPVALYFSPNVTWYAYTITVLIIVITMSTIAEKHMRS